MTQRMALAFLCAAIGLHETCAKAGDWPQLAHDAQRTGFTTDSPAPPYNVAWSASFYPEAIYSAQPVIAGGRVFQTTLSGNLYALDLKTGDRLWYFQAGMPFYAGAAAGTKTSGGEDKVFAGCMDGNLYALDAATGKPTWKYDCGAGISGSPCLAEDAVFIGNRKGVLLAFTTDGKLKWKTSLSWHIYSSPAYHDGKVLVITEDMYVHCLDAKTGKPVWKSEQLYGCMNRDQYPLIHKGRVFVRTTPAEAVPLVIGPVPFGWPGFGVKAEDVPGYVQAISQAMAPGGPGKLPDLFTNVQKIIEDDYRQHPAKQTFYVLDEKTGKQTYFAVHHYCAGGLEGPVMPPAVCHDGTLMAMCVMANNGVGGATYCRFDPDQNRWVDILSEWGTWATDNSDYVTVGGRRIFSKGYIGSTSVFDLANRNNHGFKQPTFSSVRELQQNKEVKLISVLDHAAWSPLECSAGLGRGGWNNGGIYGPPISGNYFLQFTGTTQSADLSTLTAYTGAAAK